ncbi:MAG: hypothetical protein ACI88A_003361 [Paraglaciecola sp.]|jgi:hypothetical protein
MTNICILGTYVGLLSAYLSNAIFHLLLDNYMNKRLTSSTFSLLIFCTVGLFGIGCSTTVVKPLLFVKKPPCVHTVDNLDVDGNGLYDDCERAAMLTELQKISPKIKAIFDINGDGRVTVLEQTTGRHPLSQLTNNKKVFASKIKIPWSPNIYSEWISTSALQEDAVQGKVTTLANRGTVNKKGLSQESSHKQPLRGVGRGGIEFAANAGQHLTMGVQKDARWNYRWAFFTFRIDGMSGSGDTTLLVDINRGKGAGQSSPKIWYNKNTGLNMEYVGQARNGLDRRVMRTKDIHTDGKTWNVVVMGTRYGRMYAAVNGRDITIEQPDHFAGPRIREGKTFIGDSKTDNSTWALDALLLGTTEPSEAMVRKLTGWAAHRLGFQSKLPQDHPYASLRPVLDEEDIPIAMFMIIRRGLHGEHPLKINNLKRVMPVASLSILKNLKGSSMMIFATSALVAATPMVGNSGKRPVLIPQSVHLPHWLYPAANLRSIHMMRKLRHRPSRLRLKATAGQLAPFTLSTIWDMAIPGMGLRSLEFAACFLRCPKTF